MRTPSLVFGDKMTSQNEPNNQKHYPIILNRCLKRKTLDNDISQPQSKTFRKNVDHQIYYGYPTQSTLSSTSYTNNDTISNNHPQNSIIEYIFDNNLLPVQNQIISEANSVNINELSATWNSSELLDLDYKENNEKKITHLSQCSPQAYFETATKFDCGTGKMKINLKESYPNEDLSQSEDLEDKNLSWLFNFKLDELPHLSPEVKNRTPKVSSVPINKKIIEPESFTSTELDDLNVAENVVIENSPVHTPKKPPFTYTELIEYALEDRGELTVSGIYQWISDRFTFYKSNDDRWKNSVRHNLSINPHFRKGSKAPQGAGHLWTISTRDSETNMLAWEHKKQRLELFLKMEAANISLMNNRSSQDLEQTCNTPDPVPSIYDETAAATASIAFTNDERNSPEIPLHVNSQNNDTANYEQNHINYNLEITSNTDDLRKTAGEILNGVRRNVEVQILNPPNYNNFHAFTLLESRDYLNPISKDEIAQECGLRTPVARNEMGNEYYVTEIDPIELGIHMAANENEEALFGDDFSMTYLGIGSGNNILA